MQQTSKNADKSAEQERVIWCATYANSVLLLPDALLNQLLAVRHALSTAQNWQEFLDLLPAEDKELMLGYFEDQEAFSNQRPADVGFEPDQIDWYLDGDWPASPTQKMLDWLPESIQERFGESQSSRLNGEFLEIPEVHFESVMAELEALGYRCRIDEPRVLKAIDMS